ncbi:hypothetical protein M2189_003351 [Bradyrhizobium japonicum]|nr:hypothetical protein [Bradyrhizobium japonicum]MCS3960148.1 hypothetical protein [Bradyrhizobium japonicum]MCS4001901.1 hypothetical protein [Bradyrhizobium japonicum]
MCLVRLRRLIMRCAFAVRGRRKRIVAFSSPMFATIRAVMTSKLTRVVVGFYICVNSLIYLENYSIVLTTHFTGNTTTPRLAGPLLKMAGAPLPAVHGVRPSAAQRPCWSFFGAVHGERGFSGKLGSVRSSRRSSGRRTTSPFHGRSTRKRRQPPSARRRVRDDRADACRRFRTLLFAGQQVFTGRHQLHVSPALVQL